MEGQTRLMSWYWKQKQTWRKDLIRFNSYPWIMFSFNWLAVIWRGGRVRLKLDVQGQAGGNILDVAGQEGRGSSKLDNFHGRNMCSVPWGELLSVTCRLLVNSLYEWLMIVRLEGFLKGEVEVLRIEIALNFFIYVFVRLTLIGFTFCKSYWKWT